METVTRGVWGQYSVARGHKKVSLVEGTMKLGCGDNEVRQVVAIKCGWWEKTCMMSKVTRIPSAAACRRCVRELEGKEGP